MSNDKRQIVFIEPNPNVIVYRIARSLKLTGKYETILVCFSNVDKEFFNKAYDKILILELNHKLKFKNLIGSFKKIFGETGRNFFKEIKEMRPSLFQITGPDLFSLLITLILRKNPSTKVYYSNDLWSVDKRNFFLTKEFWIKGEFQKFCERVSFKIVDGILNKKSIKEFDLIKYKVEVPKMSLPPLCLDEWIFSPKEKKKKKIEIVYGASPQETGKEQISFMDIIKVFSSQKIYFHTYGPCLTEKDNQIFIKEAKSNEYYLFHEKVTPYILNKEMSNYHYGFLPHFFGESVLKKNPGLAKTQMVAKLMNYLEAGLPVIMNKELEYIAEIVEKYGIGFTIELKDLKNLKEIIEKKDYKQLQKNVKKFQQEFKASKKIKDVIGFYEKVKKIKEEKRLAS